MKRIIILSTIFALFGGCKEEEPIPEENKIPTCEITSPINGAEIIMGETVTINVDANDSDGNVTEVRFYIDGNGVASASSFPYNYEWNTSAEELGNHIIKVSAKENDG